MPSRARNALFPMALALTFCLIDIFQMGFWETREQRSLWTEVSRTVPPWLISALLFPLVRAVCQRVPLELRARPLAIHLAGAFGYAMLQIVLIASYNSLRYFDMTWAVLFRRSLFWNLGVNVMLYGLYAGALAIVTTGRALVQRDQDALELKASLAEARLAGLRAQLNPHFLYNVLNTAAMLAREQRTEETVSVLARLGDLLRYVLREEASGETELRDEVEFLRRYLDLERIRFADRLQVSFEVDPALDAVKVPSLLLQPLVENAVRHGISQKPGAGHISIRAERNGNDVHLEVVDDGPGPDAGGEHGNGLGVRNTRARLASRYGAAAGLTVEAAPGGGTRAVVILPCEAG
jgi:sensor histidine kinase YesM